MLAPRPLTTAQPATDALSPPLREATDSGRAQPVFLNIAVPSTVRIGARFTALINAETENDVSRVVFTLQYDPRIVRVIDASAGDFMSQVAPMLLVAYITTMLSADIRTALMRIKILSETDELTGIYNVRGAQRASQC